jgi:hypothetical protein
MTASVSITTKYGQPCVCHPVAAPGAKSQRVIRTAVSSCWTVGTAGWSHLNGMTSLPEPAFLDEAEAALKDRRALNRLKTLDFAYGQSGLSLLTLTPNWPG